MKFEENIEKRYNYTSERDSSNFEHMMRKEGLKRRHTKGI